MARPLRSRNIDDYSDRTLVELLADSPEVWRSSRSFCDSLKSYVDRGKTLSWKQRLAAFKILIAVRGFYDDPNAPGHLDPGLDL